MARYWMRLAPPGAGPPRQRREGTGEVRARLTALLGCRWVWSMPHALAAWGAVLEAFDVGASHRVHVPVGFAGDVGRLMRGRGAFLVEVDLHESNGAPIWPDPDARADGERDVFVLDHRFGLPSPVPRRAGLVLEDATAAAGGALNGRPVGSLGGAAIVGFGNHPFGRSRGALVATNDRACADRLQHVAAVAEPADERAGDLAADLAALDDWNEGCRAAAAVYGGVWRGLTDVGLRPVLPVSDAVPTYSAYLVHVPDPSGLIGDLAGQGIEAQRPLDAGIERLLDDSENGRLPGARAFYRGALRLPNHPDLDVHELLHAADAVRRFLQARCRA